MIEHAESFAIAFRGSANALAMQFGGPLYLVGSMLTSPLPGDIDLRLQLEREDLVSYFGEDFDRCGIDTKPAWLRRKREELKQSRRLSRAWSNRDKWPRFDFQFQCTLFGEDGLPIMRDGKPSIRLDAVPLEYFVAGRGEP